MSDTKLLYLEDAYLKTAIATVKTVKEGNGQTIITLDQTIFYPQGGGQPSDKGEIIGKHGTFTVTHVQYRNGVVEHLGRLDGVINKGEAVTLTLDWELRYQHMQLHTAGHIVDEAVKLLLPEFHGIDGMHGIGNKHYIVYEGFIDEINKDNIIKTINQLIQDDLPITSRMVTRAVIEKENIFIPFELPQNKPLRLVQYGSLPPVPDGGTQLKSTIVCWPITLKEFEYSDNKTIIHYGMHKPETPPHTPNPIQAIHLNEFKAKIDQLLQSFEKANKNESTRTEFLGKKGKLNQVAALIRILKESDRKHAGTLLNKVKRRIEEDLNQLVTPNTPPSTWFDITAPGDKPPIGYVHLITETIVEIESIFTHLGFIRRRYPEIETDWYYAEGLNIPKNHPARDDQETFYISDNVVLTAHTSNGQLREMELMGKPPIRMINIGKTYRRQASNTHSPMFHQFEGLLVDKGINMTHLIGVSNYFAKQYFGPDRVIRLRPHHFQFTEPSFEVDINCHICQGTGRVHSQRCKVCKGGWLELGGAGMVHPVVLKNGGIDPEVYSGFAFGWGVERVIMMKHNISDNLRDLYSTDLRFLQQR